MNTSHQALIDKIRSIPKLIFSDDFEIIVQETDRSIVSFSNGGTRGRQTEELLWVSVRLQHQKRPGRASTIFFGEQSLFDVVEAAFEAAQHSSPDPWFRFPIWRPQLDDAAALPEHAVGAVADADDEDGWPSESLYPKIVWRPDRLDERLENWSVKTSRYRKSEKQLLKTIQSGHTLTYTATQQAGDTSLKIATARSGRGSRVESEQALEGLLKSVYFRQGGAIFSGQNKGGVMFGAQPTAEILRAIAPWFSAERVQHGTSPLCGRLGERIAAPGVNLSDEPHHSRAAWGTALDLEGSPTRAVNLIEQGVSAGLLYDVYTATRENRLSSGNLMRRLGARSSEILPWHLMLKVGTLSQSEMLRQLNQGYFFDYCSRLEEDHDTPNIFTFYGMGWRVKNAEPDEPIWYIRIKFDVFDLLKKITAVGDTSEFFGDVAAPFILVENIPLES